MNVNLGGHPAKCLSHPGLRVGKKFRNFQKQGEWKILRGRGGIFKGGSYIFQDQAWGELIIAMQK